MSFKVDKKGFEVIPGEKAVKGKNFYVKAHLKFELTPQTVSGLVAALETRESDFDTAEDRVDFLLFDVLDDLVWHGPLGKAPYNPRELEITTSKTKLTDFVPRARVTKRGNLSFDILMASDIGPYNFGVDEVKTPEEGRAAIEREMQDKELTQFPNLLTVLRNWDFPCIYVVGGKVCGNGATDVGKVVKAFAKEFSSPSKKVDSSLVF